MAQPGSNTQPSAPSHAHRARSVTHLNPASRIIMMFRYIAVLALVGSASATDVSAHARLSEIGNGLTSALSRIEPVDDFSNAGRSLLQLAPDKSCCVAAYGDNKPVATVCDSCAKLATFECRPSVAPADGTVSDTSFDCISFAYADEATCLAADGAQVWWTSSDNDGNGCPATTTSFPQPPPPPPPGQFVDNAPDGACCVSFWGESNADCTNNCYSTPGFTCRDSHQPGSVDPAGKDCISFEYATEAACTAAGGTSSTFKWSPSLNPKPFCARNDTQHLARSGALGARAAAPAMVIISALVGALAIFA